jgi:hypothetical protein
MQNFFSGVMQEHFKMGSADVLPYEWMDSFFWWYGGNKCP